MQGNTIKIGNKVQLYPGKVKYLTYPGLCAGNEYFNRFENTELTINLHTAHQPTVVLKSNFILILKIVNVYKF